MTERNECKEIGCPALCCRNMRIFYVSEEEQQRCFPSSILVDLNDVKSDRPGPVTHARKYGYYEVMFFGACPNVRNGECIWGGERPSNCKRFPFGEFECDSTRRSRGYPNATKVSERNLK